VLDSAELTAFHDAKRAEHAQERFDRFDEDGDGKLSVSEAPRFLLERFEVVDADGDGVVTAKEMAARRSPEIDASERGARSARARDGLE